MEEKRLDCHIVKDLLPLYHDQLTSEETSLEIEAHLKHCEACSKVCQSMGEELCSGRDETKERVNPFGKLKKKIRIRNILYFLAGAVVCAGLILVTFAGVIKYNSKDVSITYTATVEHGQDGEKEYHIDFEVASPNGTVMNAYMSRDTHPQADRVTLYRVLKVPFDDRGKYPNQFQTGYGSEHPFTDDQEVSFVCSDKTITFNLREIAEQEGIQ